MRVLTAEQMAAVDRRAIEEIGVPGMVLMENAALGVVDALGEVFPAAENVAVLCGPGNNGGDGLAVARHLDLRGYGVRTLLLVPGDKLGGDALTQLEILARQGPVVEELTADDDVEAILSACAAADVVVDALFGTGLSRPLAGRFAALVEGLNVLVTPAVAVDVPSGIHGSSPRPPGPHVEADLTVTFAAPKVAHVLPPASRSVGRLVVADLGVARHLVEEAPAEHSYRLHLLTEAEIGSHLAPRDADSHKGDYGHAVAVGGTEGMSGAVILTVRAAVRSGAGLVTAVVAPELMDFVDSACVESMARPDLEPLDPDAVSRVLDFASAKDAVAVGPGVGRDPEMQAFVLSLVAGLERPLVVDADGLNAFAGRPELLSERTAPTVLTPHPGEAARLLDISTAEIQSDRLAAASELARRSGAVVVLKGHRTLVAQWDNEIDSTEIWINPTGNAGMATGGSGDVLTGIVVALLARGFDAAASARLGVYVHGLAGDLAAAEMGETSLAAGDLVRFLPTAWVQLEAGS